MKLSPLNNQLNLSNNGFESFSPSMQLDSRGFPHISWMNKKLGHNLINYRFWDGLKWSSIENVNVDRSEENVVHSNNSIVLDSDNPIVCFSKKDVNGSLLTVSYRSNGEWIKSELLVDYVTKWIGIALIEENDTSSESESSSSDISNYIFVCTIDSDGLFNAYKWSKTIEWDYVSSFSDPIVSYSKIKIIQSKTKIGISYLKNDSIYYNFFDTESESWVFEDFDSISNVEESILDFDIDAYSNADVMVISLAWLSNGENDFYVRHTNVDSDGDQGVDDSLDTIVHERERTIQSNSYIVNGFNTISVFNDEFKKPSIMASGAETSYYHKDSVWNIEMVDVKGSCDGFTPKSCNLKIDKDQIVNLLFESNGEIYFFQNSQDSGFNMSNPQMVVFNTKNLFITTWQCGELPGNFISQTYNNKSGDIIKDSIRKVAIVVNDSYDPLFESSSSSSSS